MERFVKAFQKASLAWLALGVTFGVAMAAYPPWTIYRLAHVHMVLLGFVTMMIYGVAYHVIPRFSGNPLHSRRIAAWHWWRSNAGLALMAAGFVVRAHDPSVGTPLLATGGTLSALGAYAFVYVLWRTIDGDRAQRDASRRVAERMAAAPVGLRPPVAGVAARATPRT